MLLTPPPFGALRSRCLAQGHVRMQNISSSDVQHITDYLDVRADTQRADIAFVFGTSGGRPACRAAWLYKRGIVDFILCTGGVNRVGKHEARRHAEILRQCGIPDERVLVEDKSTNTGENVTFGLAMLARELGTHAVTSIIAVVKWYHSRRALMTLKRHVSSGTRLYVSSYSPINAYRQNWHLSDSGHQFVLKEWQVIPEYLARGWIAEIEFDGSTYV